MPKVEVVATPSVYRPSGYTQAVRSGDTLYIAGQVPCDREGRLVGRGDFRAQAEQVYTNLQLVLSDAGLTLRHVVKTTTFIVDPRYRPLLREIRARYFGDYLPPNSLLIVSALAEPEFLIEVEAIASY